MHDQHALSAADASGDAWPRSRMRTIIGVRCELIWRCPMGDRISSGPGCGIRHDEVGDMWGDEEVRFDLEQTPLGTPVLCAEYGCQGFSSGQRSYTVGAVLHKWCTFWKMHNV